MCYNPHSKQLPFGSRMANINAAYPAEPDRATIELRSLSITTPSQIVPTTDDFGRLDPEPFDPEAQQNTNQQDHPPPSIHENGTEDEANGPRNRTVRYPEIPPHKTFMQQTKLSHT